MIEELLYEFNFLLCKIKQVTKIGLVERIGKGTSCHIKKVILLSSKYAFFEGGKGKYRIGMRTP